MSYNLKDQMTGEFYYLEQGFMSIFEYEVHFHTLSRYSAALVSLPSMRGLEVCEEISTLVIFNSISSFRGCFSEYY